MYSQVAPVSISNVAKSFVMNEDSAPESSNALNVTVKPDEGTIARRSMVGQTTNFRGDL